MSNQKGFSHPLVIILVLLVVVAVGFAGLQVFNGDGKGKKAASGKQNDQPVTITEEKPRLKNLGLSAIGPYNPQTNMSGDIAITQDALREYDEKGLKGFYIFGDKLGKNDTRKNPNFEFASLKANTPVVASIDGVVVQVNRQASTNDYEVILQPTEGSGWTIAYDHLIDVPVLRGDSIRVGDKLGTAAVQENGLGRFELQVNYDDENGNTLHYCPSALLDNVAKTRETLLLEITALQVTWESFSGKDLYAQAAQKPPGCLSETMTPAAAEGR